MADTITKMALIGTLFPLVARAKVLSPDNILRFEHENDFFARAQLKILSLVRGET